LVGLDEETQKVVADTILGQKLSVRETERLVQNIKNPKKESKTKISIDKSILKKTVDILKKRGFSAKFSSDKLTVKFSCKEEIEKFLNLLEK